MKESDVQAAMDATPKVSADGLWYKSPNSPLQLQQLQACQAQAEQHIIQTTGLNNLPRDRCAVSGALLPAQQPNPGDSLYEECLAVQGEPEIPVTAEMIAAGHAIWTAPIFRGYPALWTEVYRAMAALAPKGTASKWWATQWQEGQARIAALEAENVQRLAERNNLAEIAIDQANRINTLTSQLAAFTGASASTDIPDPPRRPDGTLVPASKPWTPPKDTGDKRRIGG